MPGLEAAARARTASGFVRTDDDLYVYAAMTSLPWVFVVRISPDSSIKASSSRPLYRTAARGVSWEPRGRFVV